MTTTRIPRAVALAVLLALTGCTSSGQSPPSTSSSKAPTTASAAASDQTASDQSASASAAPVSPTPIGMDEAGRIATQKYGGRVIGVERDHHHGNEAWEVEIEGSHEGRIEVKVEMATGKILTMEHD